MRTWRFRNMGLVDVGEAIPYGFTGRLKVLGGHFGGDSELSVIVSEGDKVTRLQLFDGGWVNTSLFLQPFGLTASSGVPAGDRLFVTGIALDGGIGLWVLNP
jgi:hypothetical protein